MSAAAVPTRTTSDRLDAPLDHAERTIRFPWILTGVIVATHAVFAWLRRSPSLTTMNDDSFYILLARSVRQFNYVESFIVGTPPHVQYPPGYPALLALLSSVFGERYGLFVAVNIMISAAAVLVVTLTVRARFGWGTALIVATACALNPMLIEVAGMVRSEPMFLLFWWLTMWALTKPESGRAWTLLAMVCAVIAMLTRTAGVAVMAGVFCYWILRRRWRAVIVFGVIGTVAGGLWLAWIVHAPQAGVPGASYIADVRTAPDAGLGAAAWMRGLLRRAALYYTSDLPFALPVPTVRGTAIDNILTLGMLTVCLAAGLRGLWRKWQAGALVTALYVGVLAVWPFDSPRFLVPILPSIYVTLAVGALAITSRIPRAPVLGPALLWLMVLSAAFVRSASDVRMAMSCDRGAALSSVTCFSPEQMAFVAALRFAGQEAPPSSPVVAAKEATAGMVSGHPVVRVNTLARLGPAEAMPYLRRVNARLVVVGYVEGRDYRLATILERACDQLRLVRSFEPKTFVFELRSDSSFDGEGEACRVLRSRLASWGPGEPIGLW